MRGAIVGALLVFAFIARAWGAPCSVQDIEVKGWNWRIEEGAFFVSVGELVNSCPDAVGVQVQITMRNAAGAVLDVQETWPASTRNVPPGSPYAFKTMTKAVPGTTTATIRIIEVHRW